MALKDDLTKKVKEIFAESWEKKDGTVVPDSEDLPLYNSATIINGVVLYADLDDSTSLVDKYTPEFAAEVYKAFLHCAAHIIRSEGGIITAYDGDRIMAVYLGDYKNTSAARTALKLNYARIQIINPAIKAQYPSVDYELRHTVGVDASKLFVSRIGVKGDNDLVWVGRAANHAAKLTALNSDYASWITKEVYDRLSASVKVHTDGSSMWEARKWTINGRLIYRSNWLLPV